MTKKTFSHAEETYTAPLCTMSEISPEGILCSSIERLGNEFNYVWGDEE